MDETQGVGGSGQRGAQVIHSSSVKIEQDDDSEGGSDIDSSNNA